MSAPLKVMETLLNLVRFSNSFCENAVRQSGQSQNRGGSGNVRRPKDEKRAAGVCPTLSTKFTRLFSAILESPPNLT